MMRFILVISIFILSVSPPVFASDDNWEKRLAELSPSEPEECNEIFNILWEQSKKGNQEARFSLLVAMTMVHGPEMMLPSLSYDSMTRMRHIITLAAYSVSPDFEEDENEFVDGFLLGVNGFEVNSDFGKCMKKGRSLECTQKVVNAGMIPSLEALDKEFEVFINAGFKAHCPGMLFWKNRNMVEVHPNDKAAQD